MWVRSVHRSQHTTQLPATSAAPLMYLTPALTCSRVLVFTAGLLLRLLKTGVYRLGQASLLVMMDAFTGEWGQQRRANPSHVLLQPAWRVACCRCAAGHERSGRMQCCAATLYAAPRFALHMPGSLLHF